MPQPAQAVEEVQAVVVAVVVAMDAERRRPQMSWTPRWSTTSMRQPLLLEERTRHLLPTAPLPLPRQLEATLEWTMRLW